MRHLKSRAHTVAVGYLFLLVAAPSLAFAAHHPARAPVYSIAAVQGGLARHPEQWLGRTILIRDEITTCNPADYAPLYCLAGSMEPPVPSPVSGALPLIWTAPTPLAAWLARLPLPFGLFPTIQTIRWSEIAVYRIQLRVQTQRYCGSSVCYEAVLPDAVP